MFKPAVLVGISAFDYHGLHGFWPGVLASRACGKVLLPLGVVFDGVRQQRGGLAGRTLITELDEIAKPIVVLSGKVSSVDGYDGVGQSERAALVLQERNVEGARAPPVRFSHLSGPPGRPAESAGEDGAGPVIHPGQA